MLAVPAEARNDVVGAASHRRRNARRSTARLCPCTRSRLRRAPFRRGCTTASNAGLCRFDRSRPDRPALRRSSLRTDGSIVRYGCVPIAEVAHAHASRALLVEPMQRALFALAAQFERIDCVKIFDLQMLERFEFDRQTVHVPARNELRPLPVEQRDLDEHVLEHHVQEMAHVQVAVRVRRPVVQNPRLVRLCCAPSAARRCAAPATTQRDPVRVWADPLSSGKPVFGKFRFRGSRARRSIAHGDDGFSREQLRRKTSKFRAARARAGARRARSSARTSASRSRPQPVDQRIDRSGSRLRAGRVEREKRRQRIRQIFAQRRHLRIVRNRQKRHGVARGEYQRVQTHADDGVGAANDVGRALRASIPAAAPARVLHLRMTSVETSASGAPPSGRNATRAPCTCASRSTARATTSRRSFMPVALRTLTTTSGSLCGPRPSAERSSLLPARRTETPDRRFVPRAYRRAEATPATAWSARRARSPRRRLCTNL